MMHESNTTITETRTQTEEGLVYEVRDGASVLLTIWDKGWNTYRARNGAFDITASVAPYNDYITVSRVIEYKQRDRAGRYRKGGKLQDASLRWLVWYLENHGFIRKPKVMK